MQKLFSYLICCSLLFFGMNGCSDNNRNNLDSWLGNYNYEETPVKSLAGYSMVMTWDFSVNKIANMYKAILNVNGQQTDFSIVNNLKGSDTTLFVIYDTTLSGISQEFHKGDTLFSLSKAGARIITKWNRLKPILLESAIEKCNCFVFTGVSQDNNSLRISQ